MRSQEITIGRTFGVTFEHGEDFFSTLANFCEQNGVRYGYIPMFLGGFSEIEIVGTCEKPEDPDAPTWSTTYLRDVDSLGCGTIAYDEAQGQISPHVHLTVGMTALSADARTSHLVQGRVQFVTELIIVEVTEPAMRRVVAPNLYDLALLDFNAR